MAWQWFYTQNGQQSGPVSAEELNQMAKSGRLQPTDMVWRDGMPQWVMADSIGDLFPAPVTPAQTPYQPYPSQVLPYYGVPPVPAKPTSITVLGIIGIVLAALGLCGVLFASINPVLNKVQDPVYRLYMAISSGIGGILVLVQLIACIACLNLKEWGRKLLVAWAMAQLVLMLIGVPLNLFWVIPKITLPMLAADPNMQRLGWGDSFVYASTFAGMAFGCIYPIFALVWMRRQHVVNAFAKAV